MRYWKNTIPHDGLMPYQHFSAIPFCPCLSGGGGSRLKRGPRSCGQAAAASCSCAELQEVAYLWEATPMSFNKTSSVCRQYVPLLWSCIAITVCWWNRWERCSTSCSHRCQMLSARSKPGGTWQKTHPKRQKESNYWILDNLLIRMWLLVQRMRILCICACIHLTTSLK